MKNLTPFRPHQRVSELLAVATLLAAFATAKGETFSFQTIALRNQAAPGAPVGYNFSSFDAPVIDQQGHVAFHAILNSGEGLWSTVPGTLSLVARFGATAADTPAGVFYSYLSSAPVLNNGRIAFSASLSGNVTDSSDRGIWSGPVSNLSLVARTGNAAAGLGAGVTYANSFTDPVLNSNGQVAFNGGLAGPGVDGFSDQAMWRGAPGSLTLVARSGSQAPGADAGANYAVLKTPDLNASGQVVFSGFLSGTGVTNNYNNYALWNGAPGSLSMSARTIDPAPGTTATYGSLDTNPTINSAGQVAFRGIFIGSGVTSANNHGILRGTAGNISLVVRAGDPAIAAGGGLNFGTVTYNQLLNASGDLGFFAQLTGTGVTTANDESLWKTTGTSLDLVVREGTQAPGLAAGVLFGALNPGTGTHVFALNDQGVVAFLSELIGTGVTSANDRAIWIADDSGNLSLVAREGDAFSIAPGDTRTISYLNFLNGADDENGKSFAFNDAGQLAFLAQFTDNSSGIFLMTPIPEPASLSLLSGSVLFLALGRPRRGERDSL